jgi:hypothetical protein
MLSDEFQELGLAHQKHLTPLRDIVSLKDSAPPPESSITAPADTVHQYMLKSRWKYHALVTVMSHATNARDSPLLYFGEELKGFVELTLDNLSGMQSMDVVVSRFPNYRRIIAIQPGSRSCRCSIRTQLSHRVRPSASCYRSTSIIRTSRTENSFGPLPLRPCRLRGRPGVHPQLLFRPLEIGP